MFKKNITKIFLLFSLISLFYTFPLDDINAEWVKRDVNGSRFWSAIASSLDGSRVVAVDNQGYIYISTDNGINWTETSEMGYFNWMSVASSDDGMNLVATSTGDVYTSTDGGVTWVEREGSGDSVASSADGLKLVRVRNGSYIYTSTDGGVTWVERTGAGLRSWMATTSSFDGSRLVAGGMNSYIYTSTDSGVTWTEQTGTGTNTWISFASSDDGLNLAAVTSGGYIYTSIDGGVNWTQQAGAGVHDFVAIASSADGIKLAAVVEDGYIYTSTDSGVTWTEQTGSGINLWKSISSSADGSKLVAGISPGSIYNSTDSGVTWTEGITNGTYNWSSVTSSDDGVNLIAADNWGFVYVSNDSGQTWSEVDFLGPSYWSGSASSADGQKMIVVRSGYIYTSTDGGINWTQQTGAGSKSFEAVASSSDGLKLVVVTDSGYIYTSTDGGVTWTEHTAPGSRRWFDVASSADGMKLFAVHYGGYIYTSVDGGTTWTEQTGADGTGYWRSIASSDDGSKVVALETYDLYLSSDGGTTWTKNNGIEAYVNYLKDVTLSSDGNTIIVADDYDDVYISFDFGATWRVLTGLGEWNTISSSADGTKIIGGISPGYLYTNNVLENIGSTIETNEASDLFSSNASLNGNIIETGGYNLNIRGFEYGLTTSYGQNINEAGSFGVGSYSLTIGSLTCETEYHYRAYVTNALGTFYGGDQIFSTVCPTMPSVETSEVLSITNRTALLNGNITDNGGEVTTRGFEYGLTNSYGNSISENGFFANGSYSLEINDLTCEVTYHFRSYVTNASGTSYGEDNIFTTSACSPELIETIIPNEFVGGGIAQNWNADDDYWQYNLPFTFNFFGIDYSLVYISSNGYLGFSDNDMDNYSLSLPGADDPVIAIVATDLRTDSTGRNIYITDQGDGRVIFRWDALEYGTTNVVNFEIILSNDNSFKLNYGDQTTLLSGGGAVIGISDGLGFYVESDHNGLSDLNQIDTSYWSYGVIASTPSLVTGESSLITRDSATLSANITALGGEEATVRGFEYGETTSYGMTSLENGNFTTGAYSREVSSLSCATTYHFRSYAINSAGTGYGQDQTFTTGNCLFAPELITEESTSIGNTVATLNGEITNTGGENATVRGFEYGQNESYGLLVKEDGDFTMGQYSLDVDVLSCNSIYHYRAFATNSFATSYGQDKIFTTERCPSRSTGSTAQAIAVFKAQQQILINQSQEEKYQIPPNLIIMNTPITQTLKQGINGQDTKQLQTILNNLGYDTGTPDGLFGPKTKQAVINFQKANNLISDGIVGPQTIQALNNQTPTVTPTTTTQEESIPLLSLTRTLKQGMQGEDVKQLQIYLNTHNYPVSTEGDGSLGKETTYFGSKTKQAVINFQKANNLTPDGIVGSQTRGVMK